MPERGRANWRHQAWEDYMNRIRAMVAGLVLALVTAFPVAAATTADVTESLTVASTLSLTLNRSTIDWGTLSPGGTSNQQVVIADISGNQAWTLTAVGTSFDKPGAMIPAQVRKGMFSGGGSGPVPVSGPWSVSGPANTPTVIHWTGQIELPAGTYIGGTYTGSITFTLTGS